MGDAKIKQGRKPMSDFEKKGLEILRKMTPAVRDQYLAVGNGALMAQKSLERQLNKKAIIFWPIRHTIIDAYREQIICRAKFIELWRLFYEKAE
jgi:hypothetical protein